MNDKINQVQDPQDIVDELKQQLQDSLNELKTRSRNEYVEAAIKAIELIFRGIELGESVTEGATTIDETHCNCGMTINLSDLGNGEIRDVAANLMMEWNKLRRE